MIRKKIIRYATNRKVQTTIQMMLQKFCMPQVLQLAITTGRDFARRSLSSPLHPALVIWSGRVAVGRFPRAVGIIIQMHAACTCGGPCRRSDRAVVGAHGHADGLRAWRG